MSWLFLLKHLILTLLFGPIIFIIINFNADSTSSLFSIFLEVYPIVLFMGLVFSLPTYILYAFVFFILTDTDLKNIYAKTILILLVVIGIFATTSIINGNLWLDIALSYSIPSILIGYFFKLDFKNKEEL